MKTVVKIIFLLFPAFFVKSSVKAQAAIDLETGAVFTGYNDVRIPGDNGTFFSLKEDLKPQTEFFYRIRFNYTIKSRHTFSLLYAPLEIKSEGTVKKEILFEGISFPANVSLEGIYQFNSYRLTYRYRLIHKPKFELGLGFTAKIRDAKIALLSNGLSSEKTNTGFVPIINFRVLWNIDESFGLQLEGDALAAPQGRAEDVSFTATYKISDKLRIRGGYRILEGGADNEEVYNFALFHYALTGISYTF